MNITIDNLIAVILSSFGVLLCLIVGVSLLVRKKGMKQTNSILGTLLILFSLTLLNSLMAMTGLYSTYQYLYFLPLSFSFSIGPLFYLFVKSRIQPGWIFSRKDLIHFILPAIQFLFYLSIGFRSASFKSWMWEHIIAPYGQYVEEGLLIVLSVSYLLAALRLIKKELSTKQWKHPVGRWLRKFALWLLILLGFSFSYEIADWILWSVYEYNLFNTAWLDFPLKLAYGLISLLIGYNAYLYQNQELITPVKQSATIIDNGLQVQVKKLLTEEQVYLDPELTVETFAKMLKLHRNDVAKYFTAQGSSFRSQINECRVNHFLQLLKSGKNQQFTLLGLAYESGFNSKTSFNRIFKEKTGQSPTAYAQKLHS